MQLVGRQDLVAGTYLIFTNLIPIILQLLLLLLLDNVLEESVASLASHLNISILFKLSVVALGFLRYAISEEPTRVSLVLILNGKNFVEAAQIVDLMHPSFFDLSRKFFSSHLIPKERALLVHLFELTIANYTVQVFLSVGFSHSKDVKSVLDDCLFDLVVESTICLEGGSLVDF